MSDIDSARDTTEAALSTVEKAGAVLIGLALPLLVIGRVTMQAELAVAVAVVMAALWRGAEIAAAGSRIRSLMVSPVGIGVLATLTAWLLSVAHSVDPWRSFKSWFGDAFYLGGVVLFYAFLVADDRRIRLCLHALLIGGGLALIAALVGLDVNGAEIVSRLRGNAAAEHLARLGRVHKLMGSAALCLLPVVLWAGLRLGGIWRWIGLLDAVACMALIPMVGSRSALAGGTVMVAVAAGVLAWRHRRWLAWYSLGLVVTGAGMLYWLAGRSLNAEGDPLGLPAWLIDTHRQHIWRFVFDKALESPWVGWGINAIDRVPGAQDMIPGIGSAFVPSHPHNWMLEVFAETGVIGLLPILAALVILFVGLVRDVLHQGSGWSVARLGLMIGFWSAALFNFSFWAVWWQLTFLVLFAVLSAGERLGRPLSGHG